MAFNLEALKASLRGEGKSSLTSLAAGYGLHAKGSLDTDDLKKQITDIRKMYVDMTADMSELFTDIAGVIEQESDPAAKEELNATLAKLNKTLITAEKIKNQKSVSSEEMAQFSADLKDVLTKTSGGNTSLTESLREKNADRKLTLDAYNAQTDEIASTLKQSFDDFSKTHAKEISTGKFEGTAFKAALASMLGPASPLINLVDKWYDLDTLAGKASSKLWEKTFGRNKVDKLVANTDNTADVLSNIHADANAHAESLEQQGQAAAQQLDQQLEAEAARHTIFSDMMERMFGARQGNTGNGENKGVLGAMTSFFGRGIKGVGKFLLPLFSAIGSLLMSPPVLVAAAGMLGWFIGKQINKLLPDSVKETIGKTIYDMVEGVKAFFAGVVQVWTDTSKAIGDFFGLMGDIKDAIMGWATDKIKWVKDAFGKTVEWGKQKGSAVISRVAGAGAAMYGRAANAVGNATRGTMFESAGGLIQKGYSAVGGTLGGLSARFESGSHGGGAVGWDSTGGTSYGTYQMASKKGTVGGFLGFLKKNAPDLYEKLAGAGNPDGGKTGSFAQAWKSIAAADPKRFDGLQHAYIQQTHYDPAVRGIAQSTGIDIGKRSKVLQDVLWSTAVQHGATGASSIFSKVIGKNPNATDKEIISQVYAERSTKFGSSTGAVQASVNSRFQSEAATALNALGGGTTSGVGQSVAPSTMPRVENTSASTTVVNTPASSSASGSSKSTGGTNASLDSIPMVVDNMGLMLLNTGGLV